MENNTISKNDKWKYVSIPLLIINILFLVGIILVAHFGFKNDNDKKETKPEEEEYHWAPAGNRIKTIWGEKLDPNNVWKEYPRPQLVRKDWTNLNGIWDYSIRNKGEIKPDKADGKILVPFPIESSLSGVMKTFTENQELWYEKKVNIQEEWKINDHLILNFGAVDYIADVYVNYEKVGNHIGGYSPFSFDIKKYIDFKKDHFFIVVKVIDPTDRGYQSVGKQTLTPGGIWYTPSSGIWQTVWLESLNEHYIDRLDMISDFDGKKLYMKIVLNTEIELPVSIKLSHKNTTVYESITEKSNTNITISLDSNFHPWSPDDPSIYNIEIQLKDENNTMILDTVESYTAIRKIAAEADSKKILRFKLNNKVLFHMGTLDQGYFPDGLYTPPSDEAMVWDIKKLKDLGFNTIRKHAKVENARYYYYCDILGMMVWQDMPSGDIAGSHWDPSKIDGGDDKNRTEESKQNYYHEWEGIINFGKFFPSIVVWTPFNEGWGQFETEKAANFTREQDPTRLINSASGGNHRLCGDILDIHNYPGPSYPIKLETEVNVLGEYGGLGLEIKDHTWKDDNWGYVVYKSKDEITYWFVEYAKQLEKFAQEGYSAAIYTQTTDCESEINGLITYDRKEIKIYEKQVKEANIHLIQSLGD